MYQQNLPQADKGVNFLRSTMSGLENTPPPGDCPGSHSLIYFLKGNLIDFKFFLGRAHKCERD